jgi:hypothetical protein
VRAERKTPLELFSRRGDRNQKKGLVELTEQETVNFKVGDHYRDFRLLGSRRPSLLTISRDSPLIKKLIRFLFSELLQNPEPE